MSSEDEIKAVAFVIVVLAGVLFLLYLTARKMSRAGFFDRIGAALARPSLLHWCLIVSTLTNCLILAVLLKVTSFPPTLRVTGSVYIDNDSLAVRFSGRSFPVTVEGGTVTVESGYLSRPVKVQVER